MVDKLIYDNKQVWGIIPARGGSKSILLKNIHPLAGVPLIEYVIAAGKQSERITRMICSTDSPEIAEVCEGQGVEVHWRPEALGGDDIPVLEVLQHLLRDLAGQSGVVAEYLPLLQPTSPFILGSHIDEVIAIMENDPGCGSGQTISPVLHNNHAYNQRVVENGRTGFFFREERKRCYNKQSKPSFFIFGNLVVSRAATIIEQNDVFGSGSSYIEIDRYAAMDVDGPEDFRLANALIKEGLVETPL